MSLNKVFIELFLNFGATPLVLTALITFVYVVYHISTLKSIEEYRVGKFVVIWVIIAAPQIYGLHLTERYKNYLPIHQLLLTAESCTKYRKNELIREPPCLLNGRLIEDQNNKYSFQINNQKIHIDKCHVLNIRIRDFSEFKDEFNDLFNLDISPLH